MSDPVPEAYRIDFINIKAFHDNEFKSFGSWFWCQENSHEIREIPFTWF